MRSKWNGEGGRIGIEYLWNASSTTQRLPFTWLEQEEDGRRGMRGRAGRRMGVDEK